MRETTLHEIDQITFRQSIPDVPPPHRLILMLHGWTGDENVMWIFATRFPKDAVLVAPRGFYPAPGSGYSWTPNLRSSWPQLDDFKPAAGRLVNLLNLDNFPTAVVDDVDVVGFSQGAALGFSMTLLYPERVQRVAGLSGFIPDGTAPYVSRRKLFGKSVFLANGTQDDLVPIGRARQAVQVLEQAGAEVSYCEDEVGHKLSATCFRSLADFFAL